MNSADSSSILILPSPALEHDILETLGKENKAGRRETHGYTGFISEEAIEIRLQSKDLGTSSDFQAVSLSVKSLLAIGQTYAVAYLCMHAICDPDGTRRVHHMNLRSNDTRQWTRPVASAVAEYVCRHTTHG